MPYAHGAIEETLPGSGARLEPDWALQHPLDYVDVVERGVPEALARAGADPGRVIGIGIDFTSCTVLPTAGDGTPLCLQDEWRARPHAWPKLWKHHAAQAHADRMTELARERDEAFLSRYGGRISSEWYFPKLLQIYEEDREVYEAAAKFIEATDWIVWQLTGAERRCSCADQLQSLLVARRRTAAGGVLRRGGRRLLRLCGQARDGLLPARHVRGHGARRPRRSDSVCPRDVAVAVGNVDSFVSVPGAGVERPGTLVTVVGTSICDMVVHHDEILLPGITGVVRDGILPGLYGYEAGQPAVGDMLSWYVGTLLGGESGERPQSYDELEQAAGELAPGATGLVALNWWNGNRSILADADLSGVIVGLTLATTPADIYRALLESIAFAARTDHRQLRGPRTDDRPAGGLRWHRREESGADAAARRHHRPSVHVPDSDQIPARGAAMFGAVAAGTSGLHDGGFRDIAEAVQRLRPEIARSYAPDAAAAEVYDRVYEIYRGLHDALGQEHVEWLHGLKGLRRHTREDAAVVPRGSPRRRPSPDRCCIRISGGA